MNNCEHHKMPPMLSNYYDSYIKLSKSRMIFLSEVVTKSSAADIAALLLYYDSLDNEDIITMYINSDGGDVLGLIHIYDVMQMIKSPIRTICLGKAYSAAAVLLSAGTPGERYAFQNCEIMIHGIQALFPMLGDDVSNTKEYFDFLNENNNIVMKILANHTKNTLEKVQIDCSQDVFMTSKDALNYGIIDDII